MLQPLSSTSSCSWSRSIDRLWHVYRGWAIANHFQISLVDEAVGRFLFWTPHSYRWREVVFGLLELHRLGLELALQQERHEVSSPAEKSETSTSLNTYGFSVALPDLDGVSVQRARLCLTVLQNFWPVIQELVRTSQGADDGNTQTRCRQATARRYMERIRFSFKLFLLARYWRNLRNVSPPGIMLQGGLYDPTSRTTVSHLYQRGGYSAKEEQSRLDRLHYVGRRTGRRMGSCSGRHIQSDQTLPESKVSLLDTLVTAKLRTILGELLYILRPLIQGELDTGILEGNSLRSWLGSLIMDVFSLTLIASGQEFTNLVLRSSSSSMRTDRRRYVNSVTLIEWKRRRLRLLLYVLRSPVWERYTNRAIQETSATVSRIPIVGGLLENYLWDWLYHYKLYRAEEG